MKNKYLTRAIGAIFISSLVVWAFRFVGHFPAFADTLEYVFPEKWFNVEIFRKGFLPLWNSNVACGQPHLANFQSAVFYPPFWIWCVTGLSDWFFILPLVHSLWAFLGFYFWMKENQSSPLLSVLCAISYGASAMAVLYWGFPTHMAAYAWVPWVFWACRRYLKEPRLTHWGVMVICWSLQLLAGYPYFTLYTTLFLSLWLVKEKPGWKAALYMFFALVAGLALTCSQWLPFADFLGYLRREGWQDPVYCLRWVNLLTLFSPNFLGVPGTQGYWGDYPNFIFGNLYLGCVPLVLFLWGFRFGAKGVERFWNLSALVVVVWMEGVYFPPLKLLPQRLFEIFEPTKAAFLFVFSALTAVGKTNIDMFSRSPKTRGESISKEKILFRRNGFIWAMGFLWMVDVLGVPYRVLHLVPDPYRNPQVAQAAEGVKNLANGGRILALRNQRSLYSPNVHDFGSSFLETSMTFRPNTQVIWGIPSVAGYLSIYIDGYQNLKSYMEKGYPFDGRVFDAAGSKVFVLPDRLPAFKYKLSFPQGPVYDIQNAGAMPAGWEADQVREFPDRASVFQALLDPRAFLENQVFTEKAPDGKAVRLPPPMESLETGSDLALWDRAMGWFRELAGKWFDLQPEIQITRVSPAQGVFVINTPRPGYMVFDESFAPGWRAWCDGKPEAIFRAYGYWMTALIPNAGAHKIIFRYEPVSVRIGIFISLIFGTIFGMGIAGWRMKRPSPSLTSRIENRTYLGRKKYIKRH